MFIEINQKKDQVNYEQITRMGVYGVLVQKKSILLIRKKSGIYKGLLDLPGGGIEFGETTEETLRRELKEEVSMTFEKMEWINNLSHVQMGVKNSKQFLFHHLGQIYRIFGEKQVTDCLPEEEYDWFAIANLTDHSLTPFAYQAVMFLKNQN